MIKLHFVLEKLCTVNRVKNQKSYTILALMINVFAYALKTFNGKKK